MNKTWRAALLAGAAVGAPALANALISRRAEAPPNVLGGEECCFEWDLGNIAYSVAGEGSPLLLVHGIGAGASSYEWQYNFLPLSETFRVYALDLLGFGGSDRPAVRYTPELYVRLLQDFIAAVVCDPVNAVGSSLSAAYLVAAAARRPHDFLRLMLVNPAGVKTLQGGPGVGSKVAARIFRLPVLGQTAYNVLASHRSVAHQLRDRLFADREHVTPAMVRHYYQSSHQPGAVNPIAAFVSGYLNLDVSADFARLDLPVRLVWGREAAYSPVENADAWLDLNPRAHLTVIEEAGMLPHSEQPPEFNRLVERQMR